MLAHTNNQRSVLMDTSFLTTLIVLIVLSVATMTALGQGEQRADRLIDRRSTVDHIDSRLNTDDNLASGDPRESPLAQRQALMLGMTLFERTRGDLRVMDVAAKSPAWDAGIRSGDRIQSLDGVEPDRLADWIEDMRKIFEVRQDGHAVPVSVERAGKTLDLRIKLPVSNADEVRDARRNAMALARARARQLPVQTPQGQTGPGLIGDPTQDQMGDFRRGSGGLGGFDVFFDDSGDVLSDRRDDRPATSANRRNTNFNRQRPNQFGNATQMMQQHNSVSQRGEALNLPIGMTPNNPRLGMTPNNFRLGMTPNNPRLGMTPNMRIGVTPNVPLGITPTPNLPLGTTPTPNVPLGMTPDMGGAPLGTGGAQAGPSGAPSGGGDAGGAGGGDSGG